MKLNMQLLYTPAIVFLGLYSRAMEMYIHKGIYRWMFIAFLFITAQSYTQPERTSPGEWLARLSHSHTLECYSTLRRSRPLVHTTTWLALPGITVSENSPPQRFLTVWFHLYNYFEIKLVVLRIDVVLKEQHKRWPPWWTISVCWVLWQPYYHTFIILGKSNKA